MDEKIKRISKWLRGGKTNPFKVDLFLTHKCNLKCVFCNYPKKKSVKELDKKTIMGIAEEAEALGVKIIGILGGEPFVRKDVIIDFMSKIKKKGIAGSIVTNGVLISEDEVKRIIRIKWDLIRFSLDGSNSDIHDYLRGCKGCFDKLIGTIKLFNKFKKEFNINFPTIELNTVLCRKNLEDLSSIILLAYSLEIKRIYFLPIIEFVKGIDYLKLKKKDSRLILEEIEKAEKISKDLNIISNLDEIKKDHIFAKSNEINTVLIKQKGIQNKGYIPCFMPWYAMSIDAEGNITPCGQINSDFNINLKDYTSLKKAWFSDYFKKLREDMSNKKLPVGCSRCCMPILDENNEIRKNLKYY